MANNCYQMNKVLLPLTAIVLILAYVVLFVLPAGDVGNIQTTEYNVNFQVPLVNEQPQKVIEQAPQAQSQPHIQSHPPTIKNPYADLELVSVVVLTRHGDRYPIENSSQHIFEL